MSASLVSLHDQLLGYLAEGKFVEGIEDFYAEDVVAREGSGPERKGRAGMVAAEREFLTKITAYHGIEVLGRAIDDQGGGNGKVFYEAVMRWNQSDLGEVAVQQVVVESWRDGKVAEIHFYGDFPG